MDKKAFTLVELIVVITILAVLGTIAFVSFQGYAKSARDSKRISDITTIIKALEFERTRNDVLPTPDNSVTITASGVILSYQGEAGTGSLGKVGISDSVLDPQDNAFYTYSVNKHKTEYQLLGFLEGELAGNTIISQNYASYDDRILLAKGKKLGIIIKTDSREPIEKVSSGTFDYYTADDNHTVIFGNKTSQQEVFTSSNRAELAYYNSRSCRALYQFGKAQGNKNYTIYPSGVGVEAYCDMDDAGSEVRNFRFFDGVNDHIEIPELTAPGDFEIEVDVQIMNSANETIISGPTQNTDTIILDVNNGHIRAFARVANGSVLQILNAPAIGYIDGKFHRLRLVYTHSNNQASLFIDGIHIKSGTWAFTGNEKISLIGKRGGSSRYFTGTIANVNFKSGWTQHGIAEANPYYRLDEDDNIAVNSKNGTYEIAETGDFSIDENQNVTIFTPGLLKASTDYLVNIESNISNNFRLLGVGITPINGGGKVIAKSNGVNILALQGTLSGVNNYVGSIHYIENNIGYGNYKNFNTGSIEEYRQDEDSDWITGNNLWTYGDMVADGSQPQYDKIAGEYSDSNIKTRTYYKVSGEVGDLSAGALFIYVLGQGLSDNGILINVGGKFQNIINSGESGTRNYLRDNIGGSEALINNMGVYKTIGATK